MQVTRYKRRHWAVRDKDAALVCVCVYRKGAEEVLRRLTPHKPGTLYVTSERNKVMGYYVAFPAHLVEELLKLLPPDERPIYAERFEPVVGDLVWVKTDAENAVETAIQKCEVSSVTSMPALKAELTEALMGFEDDSLVRMVTEFLEQGANALINDYFELEQNASKGGSDKPACSSG